MADESADFTERLAEIKGAEVIKSFCYTCPWTCPTEVFVRDGRVVYHKGNPKAPNNIGTRCAKGMASGYLPTDPDRLKFPMRRTNGKDELGKFERVSWDDAFTFIAEKMTAIRDKYGPEALVYLTHHDPNSGFMIALLADLYGTPNISIGHAMGCEGDRRLATLTLFGDIFPMHDFADSKYVMLWGMNMLGANQGLWESRALLQAKKKGCKLVVVDPNFTETAQKADEWIPIRPGTDGAMALAMSREIIDNNLHDASYVENPLFRLSPDSATICATTATPPSGPRRFAASTRIPSSAWRANSRPPSRRWRRCSRGRATTPTAPTPAGRFTSSMPSPARSTSPATCT